MKQVRLGNTSLLASEIGLGTVELGMDYGIPAHGNHVRPPNGDAVRILNEALDLGVNFIDTARIYGESEAIIGEALKHRRNEYILATKLVPLSAGDLQAPGLRDRVRESVETSLRLLQTDHIDLLMIHSAPLELIRNMDDLLEILRALRRNGHFQYVGASVYENAGEEALQRDGLDCLQIAYNALDRSAEQTVLPQAARKGVGIVARSVLLKGVLTWRYRELPADLGELKIAASALDRLAGEAGISLPEMAFRYVLSAGVLALCGTARSSELRSAIDSANHGPLDPALIAQIQNIHLAASHLLNPGNWSIP